MDARVAPARATRWCEIRRDVSAIIRGAGADEDEDRHDRSESTVSSTTPWRVFSSGRTRYGAGWVYIAANKVSGSMGYAEAYRRWRGACRLVDWLTHT
jgi:hypothetical protein